MEVAPVVSRRHFTAAFATSLFHRAADLHIFAKCSSAVSCYVILYCSFLWEGSVFRRVACYKTFKSVGSAILICVFAFSPLAIATFDWPSFIRGRGFKVEQSVTQPRWMIESKIDARELKINEVDMIFSTPAWSMFAEGYYESWVSLTYVFVMTICICMIISTASSKERMSRTNTPIWL